VLAIALLGYAWTGSPRLAMKPQPAPPPMTAQAQIAALADQIAQRLQAEPGDAQGWAMLGRARLLQGRLDEAVAALQKAVALQPDDPVLLADGADALAMRNGRRLAGEPMALVQRALQRDPSNPKALSLAGTEAFQRQDYAAAVAYWERVLRAAPAGSPFIAHAQAGLAEARRLGGLPPAPAAPGATITGTVTLAPALRGKAAPEDTVFVFARAAEGPRMPLAILRKQVKDLPLQFQLDDSLAMSPAAKLSSASRVVVGARVSRSGKAMPQPGDLSGQTPPVNMGAQGLKIEISQVQP
jgi:cytochrome c-type biogenesis protein CcmH